MEQSTKLCECGCGEPAPIATYSSQRWGWVKGQPKRFIKGHFARTQRRENWRDAVLWQERDLGYPSPCYFWLGCTDPLGYGRTSQGLAHRLIYEAFRGPIPEGLTLDHLCRNPTCVRPDHLQPVTHGENLRRGKGTKLSFPKAELIRERQKRTGETYAELAQVFGVEKRTINEIITKRRWVRH